MKKNTFHIYGSGFRPGFIFTIAALLIGWVGGAAVFRAKAADEGDASALPRVVVDRDNMEISESCIVEIGSAVIADTDGNGVIHVVADGVRIRFTDDSSKRELYGAKKGTPWDEVSGIGIVVEGRRNVTIKNAHVHRFKVGILARNADGLVVEGCDVSGGYAKHLKSTPVAEDSSDWLFPHRNDEREWVNQHGAGICVERSSGVLVRKCFARRRQNGIILDRVTKTKVYDNDFSFLSGWGLAMWRSSDNVISRNAFDFCIRGYSHGVYNRGQDSAGILMFEQCNRNVIAENSCTHGGDAFFGFGGRDALGEVWMESERARLRDQTGKQGVDDLIDMSAESIARFRRRGNNDNLLIGNDFSYAAAHGIEMTFGFGNQFLSNRVVGNAICGVWGGYSQDTRIAGNDFEENGDAGYGLERGGVDIEHGFRNVIEWNEFKKNKCGVHLWWDADDGLMKLPWARVNERGSAENSIIHNTFEGDEVAVQLRATKDSTYAENRVEEVGKEIQLGVRDGDGDTSNLITDVMLPAVVYTKPFYAVSGETRPIGARKALAGRENIIMTEWFPWDHESPFAMRTGGSDRDDFWEIYNAAEISGLEAIEPSMESLEGDWGIEWGKRMERPARQVMTITCPNRAGVFSYRIRVLAEEYQPVLEGVFVNAEWEVRSFPWTIDPREDLAGWYGESNSGEKARVVKLKGLELKYGFGGPSELGLSEAVTTAKIGGDHFGTIAQTELPLGKGRWRITTTSDDGVRATVDGKRVIDNWTWHGPTKDAGEFVLSESKSVEIVIEHFEIDGFSVLEFGIERVE